MKITERLQRFLGQSPRIHPSAFIADGVWIAGAVEIGENASIWPFCVLRGDIERIVIGSGSNLQDGVIVHLADDLGVLVGSHVTVGHGAILHACTVEDECLIGMRATILDGAVIGKGSIVGAGALVPKGMRVPPGSLAFGMPAKVVRALDPAESAANRAMAEKYIEVAQAHREQPTRLRG